MKTEEYISFLSVLEKLKCNTRHSWTSSGRHESVAEHSWRLAVMAMLCADEYPELDIRYQRFFTLDFICPNRTAAQAPGG